METETKMQPPRVEDAEQKTSACDSMPDFTRSRYFHGQMLNHLDFQNEQDYFREKLKLLNRCLHGYGTVCGLKVVPVLNDPDCQPLDYWIKPSEAEPPAPSTSGSIQAADEQEERKRRPLCVEIECGLALDCQGNELVVRHPLRIDLWRELSDTERSLIQKRLESWDEQNRTVERPRLYLSICFCVQPIDPVRPLLPESCNAVSECVYSKLRDSVKVRVSTEKPPQDHCRNNCCDKCRDRCLLLATIDLYRDKDFVIHNDVRRWVTVYEPVTITGISWVHGAEQYTVEEAGTMLQDQGLTIKFSRPILPETVTRGVIDVMVSEGGKGRHGGVYYIDGETEVSPDNRYLTFKDISGETLQDADRVNIILRADFILDECCRPLDGNHTGGRVPLLPGFDPPKAGIPPRAQCVNPPRRYGAWTSGNGTPGGTFESWFFITTPPRTRTGAKAPQYDAED